MFHVSSIWQTTLLFSACLILTMASAMPVMSQSSEPYCDALSATECQLVSGSVDAMSAISSGVTEASIEMLLQDIPELPAVDMAFRYDQSIGFMIGEEVASLIRELQSMTPDQVAALGDEPAVGIEMARVLINDMNFGMDMNLEMSEAMAAFLSDEMRSEIGMDLPAVLGLSIMIVDGIFYIDTASIAPFAPEITAFVDGWVGVDANPLLDMATAELAADGMSGSAPASARAGMSPGSFGMTGAAVATIDAFDTSGEIVKFLDVEPLEVDTADDDQAYFLTTVDYAEFFQSPVFRQLAVYFAEDQGAPMSEEELNEFVTIAQIMGPSLLQGLDLSLSESVEETTGYVTNGNLLLEWDLATLLTLASQSDSSLQLDAEAEPFVGFNVITSATELNDEIDLAPPAGAFVVPTEMLMSFMQ